VNNYEEMLNKVCKECDMSYMEAVFFSVKASKFMRRYNHPLGSAEMQEVLVDVIHFPDGYAELLWELTETPHKVKFTGECLAGYLMNMSISAECTLKDLTDFHKLVKDTIAITKVSVVEIWK